MKTDELIDWLATDTQPAVAHAALRKTAAAVAVGLPAVMLALVLTFGIRPDLSAAVSLPMFWVKFLLPLSLAAAGFWAVQRLGRPGVAVGSGWLALVAPFLCFSILGGVALWQAPASERTALVLGSTWSSCAENIVMLSLPVFVAALLALSRLAPTQPARAGAAAGALAAGVGAAVYALHCPEMAAPFLGVWYVVGMLLPIGFGALLGPRVLRW